MNHEYNIVPSTTIPQFNHIQPQQMPLLSADKK